MENKSSKSVADVMAEKAQAKALEKVDQKEKVGLPDIKAVSPEVMQSGPDAEKEIGQKTDIIPDSDIENIPPEKALTVVDSNKETMALPGGRDELVNKAIQDILDAEDNLKKREKSQSKFDKIVSGFKMKIFGESENKEERDANVTREYKEAQAEVEQKKEALNELIKQYARGDIESGKDKAEAIDGMIDTKMQLVDKRIEHKVEQMPNGVKKLKKTMDWWHKQKWYTQVGVTAGLIGMGGMGIAAGGVATVLGGIMTAGGVGLQSLGAMAGVEKMIDASQKKDRAKKGITKEVKEEQVKTEFKEEMISKEAPEQGSNIDVLLKGFDKYSAELDQELGKVFKVENRQATRKWITAVSAGLLVGYMGASHAIAKGVEANAMKVATEASKGAEEAAKTAASKAGEVAEVAGERVTGRLATKAEEAVILGEDTVATVAESGKGVAEGAEQVIEKSATAAAKSAEGTLESLAGQVAKNPGEFNIAVKAGDSQWEMAETLLEKKIPGFEKMNEARQTHLIDSVLEKIGKNDLIKSGEKVNFGEALGDKGFMEKLLTRNKGIQEGTKAFENIVKNNATIEKWAIANPGKALNTETVKGIIGGGKSAIEKVAVNKDATFEAIKKIGKNFIEKSTVFAGEGGVWSHTADMPASKFMGDMKLGEFDKLVNSAYEGYKSIYHGPDTTEKMAGMTKEGIIKAMKSMREYVSKIKDIAGPPKKGQTIMEYINVFRADNGAVPYDKLGKII